MNSRPTITTAPRSPADDRHARVMKYSIAMAVRIVCIVVAVLLPGWWALVPVLGAVFLPYFAVVVANAHRSPTPGTVEAPSAVVRYDPYEQSSTSTPDPHSSRPSQERP